MKSFAALVLTLALTPLGAFAAQSERSAKDIKMLRDSAVALRKENKTLLSNRMTDLANREAAEEKTGDVENPAQQKKDVSLLRESAESLRFRHPILSQKLNRFADRESGENMRESPAQKRDRSRHW